MPLTPTNKAKILAALRSRLYTQATYTLGRFERKELCCIGVAYDALGLPPTKLGLLYGGKDLPQDPTAIAAKAIGLTKFGRAEWVKWNDVEKYNFSRIANLIEEKY